MKVEQSMAEWEPCLRQVYHETTPVVTLLQCDMSFHILDIFL